MFQAQQRIERNRALLASVRTDHREAEYQGRRGDMQGAVEAAGKNLLEDEGVEAPGTRVIGDDDRRAIGRNVLQPQHVQPEPVVDQPVEELVPGALPGIPEQPLHVPEFSAGRTEHLDHISQAFGHK